jgi:hypothetical protein
VKDLVFQLRVNSVKDLVFQLRVNSVKDLVFQLRACPGDSSVASLLQNDKKVQDRSSLCDDGLG